MALFVSERPLASIQQYARPLAGSSADYDPLIEEIGDAHYVLLGEATHGTHEFYQARAKITKRLITEKNFTAVTWEADWPDALQVNRFIRGTGEYRDAKDSLRGFQRFPTWIWRNTDILELVGWLRKHNSELAKDRPKVGVYGLDLYSLHSSMDAVVAYLDKVDPAPSCY
jgi:erythromycin esterase-like protein